MLAEVLGEICGDCDAGLWSCGAPEIAVCATPSGDPVPASCTVQRGPIQFGGALGAFSGPSGAGRISPANTIEANSVSYSVSPFEVE